MFLGTHQTARLALITTVILCGSGAWLRADETRVRLYGYRSDGTRHVDKLYLREAAPTPRFWAVSFKPQRLPASLSISGTASSDEQGRGVWHLAIPHTVGNWQCVEATFGGDLHLTIWMDPTSGQVLYYGHDSAGRIQVSGSGDCR